MANNKFYGYTPKASNEKEGNRLDNYNPYEFRKGMDVELVNLGCSRLAESTPEEREKATETVLKNLESHGGYYSGLIHYETKFRNSKKKPAFKTWLKEFYEDTDMKEVKNAWKFDKMKDADFKNDKMTEPKKSEEEYTKKFETKPSPLKESIKLRTLKEAIKSEIKNALREQDEDEFDDDTDKADKAATKGAKKTKIKSGNRFDLEKEAIKDMLYRGKKGKESEHTEEDPAPKSILAVKNEMLQTYKTKFKGNEKGLEEYKDLLKSANEKFIKIIEKHVEKFGEDGKGNNITLDLVYGEDLPATIKLLGARLKAIDKEEQEELLTKTSERREIAATDMTREQHIKLLEIIRENGISLREGAMGVKTYYEIAKSAYLEGLSNGLGL